jgi:hypothetical protein
MNKNIRELDNTIKHFPRNAIICPGGAKCVDNLCNNHSTIYKLRVFLNKLFFCLKKILQYTLQCIHTANKEITKCLLQKMTQSSKT